jgi:hypothetical protein
MRMAQARLLLAVPAANAQVQEHAEAFMKRVRNIEINICAHCQGRLPVVEQRAGDLSVLRALRMRCEAARYEPRCRGPT